MAAVPSKAIAIIDPKTVTPEIVEHTLVNMTKLKFLHFFLTLDPSRSGINEVASTKADQMWILAREPHLKTYNNFYTFLEQRDPKLHSKFKELEKNLIQVGSRYSEIEERNYHLQLQLLLKDYQIAYPSLCVPKNADDVKANVLFQGPGAGAGAASAFDAVDADLPDAAPVVPAAPAPGLSPAKKG